MKSIPKIKDWIKYAGIETLFVIFLIIIAFVIILQ